MGSRTVRGVIRSFLPPLVAGIVAGITGFVLFGIAHALLIENIWNRMAGGIPFALAGGIALSFLVQELCGAAPSYLRASGAGVLAWAIVIPSTALGAWLRLSGRHGRFGDAELALELAVAFVSGFIAGGAIARRLRSSLIVGVIAGALVTVMAGPIPVTNSARATRLFLAFLPMFIAGTLVVAAVRRRMSPTKRRAVRH